MKKTYDLKILKKTKLADDIVSLLFEKPEDMVIIPGQFFNVTVSDNQYPLLRRPISVSRVDKNAFELTIKIVGQGTIMLSEMVEGQSVNMLGPLGNGFFLEELPKKAIVVGGGIGISPVKELTRVLKDKLNKEVPVLLGFRDESFDLEDFSKMSSHIEIATESGLEGEKGFVTTLLEKHLKEDPVDMVYVCGPHAMLKAVKYLCDQYKVTTQLLMEERMACGIGACLVCTCAIKEGQDIKNKRVCKDGPVFYGNEVVFDV